MRPARRPLPALGRHAVARRVGLFMTQWRILLPDGHVLLFDDWYAAHIKASLREITHGVPLTPDPVENQAETHSVRIRTFFHLGR